MQTINNSLIIANNVFFDTDNGYYGTYLISTPCCQYGASEHSLYRSWHGYEWSETDIGINTAPTSTTEGATAICHGTYTNTSTTSPGCVTIPLNGCGTLAPNTPYWLWTITNDPIQGSPLYFSNCGGTCNGSAPTSAGVGTYGGYYLHGTYGTYTGMSSSFTGGPSPAQPSVSLSVTAH